MKTFYSPNHTLHQPEREFYRGALVEPFERPERMDMILAQLQKTAPGSIHAPQAFGMQPVHAVHDAGYIGFLETCWQDWQDAGHAGDAIAACWPTRRMDGGVIPDAINGKMGYYGMASDTSICKGTWQAALAGKDVALSATDAVLTKDRAAFGLCRPPGHHAAVDQYCGYCFLNNAAISAQYARDNGYRKVAIFDVDFHHGNGTQDIFYDRDDVLFLSIHGDPRQIFPYFLGHEAETGRGAGQGCNVNYTFGPGTQYSEWRNALIDGLDKIAAFGADLLVVSLGVDTFENDPISFFKLTHDDFINMGAAIAQAGLPTVFLMEGGYAIEDVGINVVNVLSGFEQG